MRQSGSFYVDNNTPNVFFSTRLRVGIIALFGNEYKCKRIMKTNYKTFFVTRDVFVLVHNMLAAFSFIKTYRKEIIDTY